MRTFVYLKTFTAVLAVIFSGFFTASCDQTGTTTTFTGTVSDSETKKPLAGVAVAALHFNTGHETAKAGKYTIVFQRPTETVCIVFSKRGYERWETQD